MPVNLSIKNAPDDVVEELRRRAARNHRSLQGEMMAILVEAVRGPAKRSPAEILAEVRRLGLKTPAEGASIVRQDRDTRHDWLITRAGSATDVHENEAAPFETGIMQHEHARLIDQLGGPTVLAEKLSKLTRKSYTAERVGMWKLRGIAATARKHVATLLRREGLQVPPEFV
jgi:antitoxin FitA